MAAFFVVTAMLGASAPAMAQDVDAAACVIDRDEMKRLAARNAWTGAERIYSERVLAHCADLTFDDHALGAQAARAQGKTYEMYERLTLAQALGATPQVADELAAIDAGYARVEIKGSLRFLPALTTAMPFAPTERKSIEWAQTVLANTGSFKGMLPADLEYTLTAAAFEVVFTPHTGDAWHLIEPRAERGRDGGEGLVDAVGPVALLGFNYLAAAEPAPHEFNGEPAPGASYVPTEPGDLFGAGPSGEVGAEVVFTGKRFAMSGTLAYAGAFAPPDTTHQVRGWLAASYRPGNARFSIGPTYGVVLGQGTGVASYFDPEGAAADRVSNDRLPFGGYATLGGVQATAGYGVLDLGSRLQGVVEIGGSWATDLDRSYLNAGLRVGVVPRIARFRG